jgi:hypothetical protein
VHADLDVWPLLLLLLRQALWKLCVPLHCLKQQQQQNQQVAGPGAAAAAVELPS